MLRFLNIGIVLALMTLQPAAASQTYVYTMDNQYGNNTLHAWRYIKTSSDFRKAAPMSLELVGSYPTGGSGYPEAPEGFPVSDVLSSSYSVIRYLDFVLAVNAGSNSLSVFQLEAGGSLALRSVVQLEGVFPVTIAAHDSVVCVGSVDGPADKAGKGAHVECYGLSTTGITRRRPLLQSRQTCDGRDGGRQGPRVPRAVGAMARFCAFEGNADTTLGPLSGTYFRGTPGGSSDPTKNGGAETPRTLSQLSFTPRGDALIAVVKATGVFVFPILDGALAGPIHYPADEFDSVQERDITNVVGDRSGAPFSFIVTTNSDGKTFFAVTETLGVDGGVLTGGGVSTFRLRTDVGLRSGLRRQVSDTVPLTSLDKPIATPCWIISNGEYVWTSNAFIGTLSTFKMRENGRMSVVAGQEAISMPKAPDGAVINSALLTQPDFFDTETGSVAVDMALTVPDCDGPETLFVVDAGHARLAAYKTRPDGNLVLQTDPNDGKMPLFPSIGKPRPLGVQGVATACMSD